MLASGDLSPGALVACFGIGKNSARATQSSRRGGRLGQPRLTAQCLATEALEIHGTGLAVSRRPKSAARGTAESQTSAGGTRTGIDPEAGLRRSCTGRSCESNRAASLVEDHSLRNGNFLPVAEVHARNGECKNQNLKAKTSLRSCSEFGKQVEFDFDRRELLSTGCLSARIENGDQIAG